MVMLVYKRVPSKCTYWVHSLTIIHLATETPNAFQATVERKANSHLWQGGTMFGYSKSWPFDWSKPSKKCKQHALDK